jgi:hypothetical protein
MASVADDEKAGESGIYEEFERRAFLEQPDDDGPELDIVRELGGDAGAVEEPVADVTLGGYIETHNRVPAFEGIDGQPYTVDIEIETDEGDATCTAFFIFVRWAATGAGIMDHVESGDIAQRGSAEEARLAALDLSLYEVKAELDAAIRRKQMDLED